MNLIGNIIWIIFGGWMITLEYIFAGIVLCLTIIGIPFGVQCFKLAILGFAPFGQKIEPIENQSGCLSLVLNVIWILIGGIWIALTHFIWGLFFCITIIGIPFGIQHFKLAGLAIMPFGKKF